jgi:hypothetical protein
VKATRLVPLFVSLLSCRSVVAEYEPIDVSRVRDKVSTQLHQNFAIVFDQRGNRLVNPSGINTARKEPVIMGEFLDHKGLRMLIQSTFPKVVRYHAAARGEGRRDWHRLNRMFGLLPKVAISKGFQDPIEEFVLYDFTLTNEKLNQNSTNETIGW